MEPHPEDCDCEECQEWDADEELGCVDLEERLDAAFERAKPAPHIDCDCMACLPWTY